MEKQPLRPEESLTLIEQMIAATRRRVVRNAGRPMLVWGYATLATLLAVQLAGRCAPGVAAYLWLALPLLGIGGMFLTQPRTQQGEVCTVVDRAIGEVWLVTGSTAMVISVLKIFGFVQLNIGFAILLMIGIGTTVTGRIIRFRTLVAGGLCGILCAIALLFPVCAGYDGLIFGAGFIAMLIVPGHILNHASNRENGAENE